MTELLEQFLRAAMRAHYLEEQDRCPECRRSGKDVVARRARGIRHHCLVIPRSS